MRQRGWLWALIGLGGLAVGLGAARGFYVLWLDRQVEQAGAEIAAGRFEAARERLRRIARARPSAEGVAYNLGLCEHRLGNTEAALAAWGRIAPGTELAARAAIARAWIWFERGHYAEAERVLTAVLESPQSGPEAAMVRELLVVLYRTEGRSSEIRPLLEWVWTLVIQAGSDPRWEVVSRPLDLLRQYATVDLEPIPSESRRRTLAEAEQRVPEDDRVQLGLARLALSEGRYAEAERRLRGCEARRPADPAVAQAWLDWGLATGDSARAQAALGRLPDGWLDPAEVLALRAWFARQRKDFAAEQQALEQLAERDPGRTATLERLAELAVRAGEEPKARALRARKAEIDAIKDRYKAIYFRADVPTQAATLAGWAEALGRRFEARAWWTLLVLARPSDRAARENLARLARPQGEPPGLTLSDLRAELARWAGAPSKAAEPTADAAGEFQFRDEAEVAGLCFRFDNGQTPQRQLPETMGGGIGLLDYDGDGWLDVYAVQGGRLVPE
ncbi:MAG: tetratricopeptide repeat protein, partial [Isosphaeraceae bacterium]|nr:tetratricopeptide repeat protein [Isosphaeraceae bacterium]